jgi:hypothetical protein
MALARPGHAHRWLLQLGCNRASILRRFLPHELARLQCAAADLGIDGPDKAD